MITSYQVHLKVSSPVGVFTGFASGDLPAHDDAINERNGIQENLRNCDLFTFFSDSQPGTEITLNKMVINSSVFEFTITHKTDNF